MDIRQNVFRYLKLYLYNTRSYYRKESAASPPRDQAWFPLNRNYRKNRIASVATILKTQNFQ
jgi:hypothetical protein